MWSLALCASALLSACAAPGGAPVHDEQDLPLLEDERTLLRTDLPQVEAEAFLARLETLELALDAAFPWLPRAPGPALSLVLADPARYALQAEAHGVDLASGAYVCDRGELTLRYRAEDWRPLEGPPYPLEPRVRPLAAAVLRRRVMRGLGPLEPTWLEEGLAQVFVELAAHELGEPRSAARVNRERLLDAFLPLFLGAPPALERVARARSRAEMKRAGTSALAWTVVRYLLTDAELTPLLRLGLDAAAGREGAEDAWEEEGLGRLRAQEAGFEAWLRDAVVEELLLAYQEAPTDVDRWEAVAALRLVANVDLEPDATSEQRPLLVEGTRRILAEHPVPTRFLDLFAAEVERTRQSRSRLQAQTRLKKLVLRELERRSHGYGHPAVERARRDVGRALRRALDRR